LEQRRASVSGKTDYRKVMSAHFLGGYRDRVDLQRISHQSGT
jgi:hypothetical protein